MKKLPALILLFVLILETAVFAQTDDYIVSDNVSQTYSGILDAASIAANVKFGDVPDNHWARTAIIRDAALNLIKGYGGKFTPEAKQTNEEVIDTLIRVIGREREAAAIAASIVAQAPADSNLKTMQALGSLNLASQIGIITPAEYADAITQTTAAGNAYSTFVRLAPATRENVANWIVLALRSVNPAAFPPVATVQKIVGLSDYRNISASTAMSVEAVLNAKVMSAYSDNTFKPKNGVTRAELAQMLYNLDNNYFGIAGLEKKTGTVGELRNNQYTENGAVSFWRNIYVRTAAGKIDVLRYEIYSSTNPQPRNRDAVTLRLGAVSGMEALKEGDAIEYIVRESDKAVLHVQVKSALTATTVSGQLYSVDASANTINITDSANKHFIYNTAEGLFVKDGSTAYLNIANLKIDISKLPYGSNVSLKLINNTVTEVAYIGRQTLYSEIRGIVIENNADYGYITVVDSKGNELTKYYYESDMTVEKQQYYDAEDEIGYIDSLFPDFRYDPRDCGINDIEPGDVVVLTFAKGSRDEIVHISASTNYQARYGKIITLQNDESGEFAQMLVEYENKQTSWFTVPREIFVSKDGKPVGTDKMLVGDWVKLLVNQAIVGPGKTVESVKEIVIEGGEHFIGKIVKGSFAGINKIQKQMQIRDSYTLEKTGWSGYQNLSNYSISGSDIEYYYNNTRVSPDYIERYFKNSDATVYIALEKNYSGERVRKLTFRLSRDEALKPDTVTASSGDGKFSTIGNANLTTDNGTIVVRYGRLVSGKDIYSSDYARVILNGDKSASVVVISDVPDNSGIMIARGRIRSIDDGKSFSVQSMSVLSGQEWVYTPVAREFSIDHNTRFISADGTLNAKDFIGYTEVSKIDKVYYIVTDGSRATHIIEAPYATNCVKGTVYKIEGDILHLKDAMYRDAKTGVWKPVSNTNAVIKVNVYQNSVIARNNAVAAKNSFVAGDVIRAFSVSLPSRIESGITIDGYIIYVDN